MAKITQVIDSQLWQENLEEQFFDTVCPTFKRTTLIANSVKSY